jgi:hypothetical protein
MLRLQPSMMANATILDPIREEIQDNASMRIRGA